MKSPTDFQDGLSRLLSNLEPAENDYILDNDFKKQTIMNVQKAMMKIGYEVSLSQSEEIWSAYSFDKYAGWIDGGETLDDALGAIADLCESIECGENHIGY